MQFVPDVCISLFLLLGIADGCVENSSSSSCIAKNAHTSCLEYQGVAVDNIDKVVDQCMY